MEVSVVIPTKNRPVAIADAVQSVLASRYQNFDIWIIDQSDDETTQQALSLFASDERIHYRTNRRPGYGAASSRNIGIALSRGQLIAIIDDDVVVNNDWMARLVAEFKADPQLDFICGKLTAPPFDPATGYTPYFDAPPNVNKWRVILQAAGANFSMRRRLVEHIGGYDEFCGPGSRLGASDDTDLMLRMVQSGAKWKACPDIEVVHKHGFRPGQAAAALLKRYRRGNGGNFGRALRRGDLVAGSWYLARLGYHGLKQIVPGVQGEGWEGLGDGLIGFWRGFKLSPHEGYVSPAKLNQMRQELNQLAYVNR